MSEELSRYYRILDLEPGASAEEVREAYRDLAYVWHPDRFPEDPRRQQKATEKLKEINLAYQKLKAAAGAPTRSSARTGGSPGATVTARPHGFATDAGRAGSITDEAEELRRAAEEWQRSTRHSDPNRYAERARRSREDEISRLAAEQEQREQAQRRQLELRRLRTSRRELAAGLLGAGYLLGMVLASTLHLTGGAWWAALCGAALVPPAAGLRELLRQSEAIRSLRETVESA